MKIIEKDENTLVVKANDNFYFMPIGIFLLLGLLWSVYLDSTELYSNSFIFYLPLFLLFACTICFYKAVTTTVVANKKEEKILITWKGLFRHEIKEYPFSQIRKVKFDRLSGARGSNPARLKLILQDNSIIFLNSSNPLFDFGKTEKQAGEKLAQFMQIEFDGTYSLID